MTAEVSCFWSTGLSPAMGARSSALGLNRLLVTPCGLGRGRLVILQPRTHNADRLGMSAVWAAPRSLATTRGMISFPAGTEMFQFPACPLSLQRVTVVYTAGLPHSEIRV